MLFFFRNFWWMWLFFIAVLIGVPTLTRRFVINWNVRRLGPIIDPNMKCPACGGRSGALKFVATTSKGNNVPKGDPMVEHTCNICSAKFYQAPVSPPEKWFVA